MKYIPEISDHLMSEIEEITLGRFKKYWIHGTSLLMEDLGLDSLDYAQVMLAGEKFIGFKINEANINWRDIKTVEQLATLLYENQNLKYDNHDQK